MSGLLPWNNNNNNNKEEERHNEGRYSQVEKHLWVQ